MQKIPIDGFELDFEIQILKLGLKKSEIATRLGISLPTLKARIKTGEKFTLDNYKKLQSMGFKFNL